MAAALAAVLAGSCLKVQNPDEEGDEWTILDSDMPVIFRSNIVEPTTKGSFPAGSTFGVFAYYTGTSNWSSSAKPNFMYNQEVDFDGTDYTYSPIKYWPNNTGSKITFWAYSPYSADAVLLKRGTTTAYTNTTANTPDIKFTVTDGNTDFMLSTVASNKTKPAVNTPVNLTFNHALSKISFYVKKVDAAVPEKYTVKLKTVRFDGIYMTATHRNSGWAEWAAPRNSVTSFAPADASEYITLSTSYPAAGSPQAVSILMPQSLAYEYALLHIEYTIDFEGLLHTRTMISNIPLSTVFSNASGVWSEGTEYNVYVSITPDDPIEFSVTWSNWGEVHNNHITS